MLYHKQGLPSTILKLSASLRLTVVTRTGLQTLDKNREADCHFLECCHATDGPPKMGPPGPSVANYVAMDGPPEPSTAAIDSPPGPSVAP